MHRVVIMGKKIAEPRLVGKSSNKEKVKENENKGNDDFNMLYYDHTDAQKINSLVILFKNLFYVKK